MASLDEAAIIGMGKSPIPGASPCGADAVEDPQYIAVQGELAKMDRVDLGDPDWYLLQENAVVILQDKSKDVEMAAALTLALFKQNGYAGLAAGLGLATELVTSFWDGLFPSRPKRRKACLESIGDKFTDAGWFSQNQPRPEDADAMARCLDRATALKAALAARMADDPPAMDKFLQGLKERQAPKEPPPSAAPASSAGAAAPSSGGSLAVGEVSDPSSALSAIGAAVKFLREKDLADPMPYAVIRAVRWAKVGLPAEAARRQLEPPETSVVEKLTHQYDNGMWENLLKSAEAAFRSNDPLWLDLQRYVCAAMKALGANYDKARQAVVGATAGLVKRLGDGLFDLQFRSSLPLCSGETKLWVQSEVAPPQRASGGGETNGKLTEAWEKAQQLAGSGQVQEAMELLQAGLDGSGQRRDRYLWRLRMAQLCCDASRFAMAASLVELCCQESGRFCIDEWEPRLAAEAAGVLYRARRALMLADKQPEPAMVQAVRESYAKLCQLDPMAALSAEPPGK